MRLQMLLVASTLLVAAALAADPKDEINAAAKKLGAAGGYSWKSTVENAGGGNARGSGPTVGRVDKEGLACLSITRGENTTEAFVKGQKAAVKTQEGWQSAEELSQAGAGGGGGQGNRGQFVGRMLRSFKVPDAQAADLASKAKEIKKDGDAYVGDLTEDGAKSMLSFGGGANAPEVSGAKGSVKFWVKDGCVCKYEFNLQGKVSFNGNDRDVNRTTTVEIKDVGTTKVEVPEDAKKKMS